MAKPRRLEGGEASVESWFDKITGACPVPDASPTSSMSSPISLPEHAVEVFEVLESTSLFLALYPPFSPYISKTSPCWPQLGRVECEMLVD